jgi:SAM-dependent methyltransferase
MTDVEWRYVACNLCGADDAETLIHDRVRRGGEVFDFPIVRCRRCGLIYTNPRAHSTVFGNVAGGAARGDAAVANQPIYRRGMSALDDHLPQTSGRPARLLDVGCAAGDFMAYARNRGWDVVGADISPKLVSKARARGFAVVQGDLRELDLAPASYDVVTMWDVIEHLTDPQSYLRHIRRLLRPGGLLFFHTGNARFQIFKARVLSRLLPDRGPFVIPYQHLYHFDPATARRLLLVTDYEPIAVFSCGTLAYPSPIKRLLLGTFNAAAARLARFGLPLWTSAMGVLARRPT